MANEVRIEMIGDESDLVAAVKKTDQSLDQLNGTIKAQSSTIGKSAMSWTDFRSAYSTALDVLRVGQQVMAQTVNVAQDYDQEVKSMMLSTGGTADQTSRLIQVVDDAGVSYGTLKTALKFASKEGIEPNIESLAQLSDQYLALAPGVERNQFLMEKFGRNGMEMARALDLGGDAMRKMAGEMEGGLVLTEQNIKASEEYRKNLDEMGDTMDGLKVKIGNELIPVLNDAFDVYQKTSDQLQESAKWYEYLIPPIRGVKTAVTLFKAAQEDSNEELEAGISSITSYTAMAEKAEQATYAQAESLEDEAEAAKLAAEALSEMTAVNNDMLSLTMSIGEANLEYNESLAETIAKYGEASEEVTALKDAHAEAMMQIAVDLEIAKLKADGFTDAEYQMALALMESTGQLSEGAAQTAANMDLIASAAQNAGAAGMEAFGGIMQNVMADGVIDAQELQSSLDTFNTILPQEQVTGLQAVYEAAAASGINGTDEVQSGLDALTTDKAVANIDALTAALYRIPSKVTVLVDYVSSGTPPPGIEMSQYGFRQL